MSYESVLLVKPDVAIYEVPPRTSNRGYRANDWNLDNPQWRGRMRLVSKDKECYMNLEDKTSGELYARCPIDQYPGIAIESVTDSSRYFVIRVKNDEGHSAFIGLGFADRSDSFDLNVALQEHFKWVKKTEEMAKEEEEGTKSSLDFRFKEGETIKINMKITKKDGSESTSKPKARATGGGGILPPPPTALKLPAPPKAATTPSPSNPVPGLDLLSLGQTSGASAPTATATSPSAATTAAATAGAGAASGPESWGDFTAAAQPSAPPSNPNWVQF